MVYIEPGITPQAVRGLHEADRSPGGRYGEEHRHYFLRVTETESRNGSQTIKRYGYKCSCGEEVS
jgi:hypothetical protein